MRNFIKLCCEFLCIFLCVQQCVSDKNGPSDLCEVGGVSGTCIVLSSCTLYAKLIKSSETLLEGLQITQARQCGFEGSDMKVCCPLDTTNEPATSPTPDEKSIESDDFVADFPKPGECGKTFEEKYIENQYGGLWSFKPGPLTLPTTLSQGIPAMGGRFPVNDDRKQPPPAGRPVSGGYPVDDGTGYTTPSLINMTPLSGGLPVDDLETGPIHPPVTEVPPVVRVEEPIPVSGGYPVDERGFFSGFNLSRGIPVGQVHYVSGGRPVGPKVEVSGGLKVNSRDYALWMALLGYKGADVFWQCGGTIITSRHVLTAAHCIKRSLYLVRIGEIDLAKTEKLFSPIDILVRKAIPHEDYRKFHNDIAIVVLEDRIDFAAHRHISPICLPSSPTDQAVQGLRLAQNGVITGWGETEKAGNRPTHLLYAPVDIQDRATCAAAYPRETVHIDERVICAGDRNNRRDACNGDSGGPLITMLNATTSKNFAYYQLGIVSFGFPCRQERYSGVYTNVTHYMPWIEEKVLGKTRHWRKNSYPFNTPVLFSRALGDVVLRNE